MKREVGQLKREIAKVPRNERGRRRYGSELRGRVVQTAKRWRGEGNRLTKLAKELGLRDSMLSEWLRKATDDPGDNGRGAVGRLRSVEVVEDASGGDGLTMKFPNGAAVDGLSLEDIAFLIKQS